MRLNPILLTGWFFVLSCASLCVQRGAQRSTYQFLIQTVIEALWWIVLAVAVLQLARIIGRLDSNCSERAAKHPENQEGSGTRVPRFLAAPFMAMGGILLVIGITALDAMEVQFHFLIPILANACCLMLAGPTCEAIYKLLHRMKRPDRDHADVRRGWLFTILATALSLNAVSAVLSLRLGGLYFLVVFAGLMYSLGHLAIAWESLRKSWDCGGIEILWRKPSLSAINVVLLFLPLVALLHLWGELGSHQYRLSRPSNLLTALPVYVKLAASVSLDLLWLMVSFHVITWEQAVRRALVQGDNAKTKAIDRKSRMSVWLALALPGIVVGFVVVFAVIHLPSDPPDAWYVCRQTSMSTSILGTPVAYVAIGVILIQLTRIYHMINESQAEGDLKPGIAE